MQGARTRREAVIAARSVANSPAREDRDQRGRPQLGAHHDGAGQESAARVAPGPDRHRDRRRARWWRSGMLRPGARLDRIHEVMGGRRVHDRDRPRAGRAARTRCGHRTSARSTFESTRSTRLRSTTHDSELRSPRRLRRLGGEVRRASSGRRRSRSEANRQGRTMAALTMKELLEAGVHFGHQTKRWNPKMQKYIFGERNGIYIIDLQKTLKKFREAYAFMRDLAAHGGTVLFVGTKKQAQEAVLEEAAPLRAVLRQPPLAGRHPDQLRDDPEVHRAPQEARRDEGDGRVRAAAQEGSARAGARAREAARRRWSASRTWTGCPPPSSSSIRRRRHRGRGGAPARHPDRGHRGHQLRSHRHRLPGPGQRRRHPRRCA